MCCLSLMTVLLKRLYCQVCSSISLCTSQVTHSASSKPALIVMGKKLSLMLFAHEDVVKVLKGIPTPAKSTYPRRNWLARWQTWTPCQTTGTRAAMAQVHRQVERLEVFREVRLGEGLDAVECAFETDLHRPEPERVPKALRNLGARPVNTSNRPTQPPPSYCSSVPFWPPVISRKNCSPKALLIGRQRCNRRWRIVSPPTRRSKPCCLFLW